MASRFRLSRRAGTLRSLRQSRPQLNSHRVRYSTGASRFIRDRHRNDRQSHEAVSERGSLNQLTIGCRLECSPILKSRSRSGPLDCTSRCSLLGTAQLILANSPCWLSLCWLRFPTVQSRRLFPPIPYSTRSGSTPECTSSKLWLKVVSLPACLPARRAVRVKCVLPQQPLAGIPSSEIAPE